MTTEMISKISSSKCSNSIGQKGALLPRLARGRDGAIDLLDDRGPQRCVVEFKFIGREATDTPADRWRSVYNNLRRNLPNLLELPAGSRSASPYRPWIDTERPIRDYRFCVSAIFATPARQDDLRKTIEADFRALAGTHEALRHLTNIRVDVHPWDFFHGQLRGNFPLRFRWFGDLPRGLEPLGLRPRERTTFKAFLDENTLSFVSRKTFLQEVGGGPSRDEEHWVGLLDDPEGPICLLVTGPGGVGKTRLSLELGKRLENRGWLPVRISRTANGDAVDALVRSHSRAAKVVFLLDYAEATASIAGIIDAIRRAVDSGQHASRLIATCRSSAIQVVRDAFTELDPVEVHLSAHRHGDAPEDAFARFVVHRILDQGGVPDPAAVAAACDGLPVLAAFAVFLYQRAREHFSAQFGDLLGIADFRTWAERRITILCAEVNSRTAAERSLAELALRLPMTRTEADLITDKGGDPAHLFERLAEDRWIETEGEAYVAAHDVFADALAARFIFGLPNQATDRLATLLRATCSADHLGRALVAIDRLAAHPGFSSISGEAVVRNLLGHDRAAVLRAHAELLRGRLLDAPAKIALLDTESDLRSMVAGDRNCDGSVSHLADVAAKAAPDGPLRIMAIRALRDALEPAVLHPHPSNMVLRRAFALDPPSYRSRVLARIAGEPVAPQTHYLLVAWLHAGHAAADVQVGVSVWLRANAAAPKASFVYQGWLGAGGETKLVRDHIGTWLAAHHAAPEAQFVYNAWLGAGGETKLVRDHIGTWLAAHHAAPEARFVYQAWLDAGGETEPVRDHIGTWLATHHAAPDASHVYEAWLDAGGETEPVRNHIGTWLATHHAAPEASHVYKAWLDAGGETELVRDHIGTWLAAHHAAPEAQFVYNAWLDAGGETELARVHIGTWLATHHAEPEASHVYKAWLDAGGETDLVRDHIGTWLATHHAAPEADFVFKAWLEAGGAFSLVRDPVLAWLVRNRRNRDAVFALKFVVREVSLPTSAVLAAAEWCERFAEDDDAIWRLATLARAHWRADTADVIGRAALRVVEAMRSDRLDLPLAWTSADPIQLADFTLQLFEHALITLSNDPAFVDRLAAAHLRLLFGTTIYSTVRQHRAMPRSMALVRHVKQLLDTRQIVLSRDRVFLHHFKNWLRSWPADEQQHLRKTYQAGTSAP